METADGRHSEIAIPLNPRNIIIWALVCERPHPRMKPACSIDPTRYISLAPIASASEPDISNEHPLVRAWILDGHSNKDGGISSSFAMVGKATVVRPLRRVEIPVISVTEAITTVVRDFDVIVSVLSRL